MEFINLCSMICFFWFFFCCFAKTIRRSICLGAWSSFWFFASPLWFGIQCSTMILFLLFIAKWQNRCSYLSYSFSPLIYLNFATFVFVSVWTWPKNCYYLIELNIKLSHKFIETHHNADYWHQRSSSVHTVHTSLMEIIFTPNRQIDICELKSNHDQFVHIIISLHHFDEFRFYSTWYLIGISCFLLHAIFAFDSIEYRLHSIEWMNNAKWTLNIQPSHLEYFRFQLSFLFLRQNENSIKKPITQSIVYCLQWIIVTVSKIFSAYHFVPRQKVYKFKIYFYHHCASRGPNSFQRNKNTILFDVRSSRSSSFCVTEKQFYIIFFYSFHIYFSYV